MPILPPAPGRFSAGNVFLPQKDAERATCKAAVEQIIAEQGQRLVGWRKVPTDSKLADIGPTALAGEPVVVVHDEIYREQIFIDDAGSIAQYYPYTIVVNSLSKSNALTGMRVGWILARREIAENKFIGLMAKRALDQLER